MKSNVILFLLFIIWFANALQAQQRHNLVDSSFYMPVEDDFEVQGEGLVVVGKISTGKIAVGQRINIMGIDGVAKVCLVSGIFYQGNKIFTAVAGQIVGLIIPTLTPDEVMRGMVAIQTTFGKIDTYMDCELEVFPDGIPYTDGSSVTVFINGIDVPGCDIIMEPGTTIEPGEKKRIRILCPVYITQIPNLPFCIRKFHPYKVTAQGNVIMTEE